MDTLLVSTDLEHFSQPGQLCWTALELEISQGNKREDLLAEPIVSSAPHSHPHQNEMSPLRKAIEDGMISRSAGVHVSAMKTKTLQEFWESS